MEVPYVRTLGNIHGNFLNEILFYYFTNKSPTIPFPEIYKSFEKTSKMLRLENCLCVYSWYGSRRLVKLVLCFLCSIWIEVIKIQPIPRSPDWPLESITKSPFWYLTLEGEKELWSCKLSLHLTWQLRHTDKTKKKGCT